ncbi:MAG: HlyD family secretion protein [Myxococcota bacterium]
MSGVEPGWRADVSSLQLARAPAALRIFVRLLILLFLLVVLSLIVVPWQQNVPAAGRVSALDPFDRTQTIAAPVSGRVRQAWVAEGSKVAEGDRLLEIVDNDPAILSRLERQREALGAQAGAAEEKVRVYETQVEALSTAQNLAVEAAQSLLQVAAADVRSARHAVDAAEAAAEQARLNFERQRQLEEEGLASSLEFEVAERVYKQARAELEQRRQALRASLNEEKARLADLGRVKTEAQARIESARAERQSAQSEVAAKEEELSALDVRIAQQNTQLIVAPRSGTVFRLYASPGAELVKAGDPLVALIPEVERQAVELWVDGNHVPLIRQGRAVRLQFEGWPAVQFSGWPSVAVGTFGGRVAFVDPSGDGQGHFRILVVPDEDDAPWPSAELLRQGARANGFVLLDRVRLGYELWRQANGFPPTVAMESRGETPPPRRGTDT